MQESEESFVEQLRNLVSVHMEPDKEDVGLFMGIVNSEIRRHSIKSGLIDDIEYVFAREHPDIGNYGWDVMSSSQDIYETLGVHAESCSIPFDTPVNSENGDAWREYGECVIALVKECGAAFSHVDSEGMWITNCVDPRGQLEKDELDLIQDLSELSALHLAESGSGSVLFWGDISPTHRPLANITGTMKRSGLEYVIITGENAARLISEKQEQQRKTSANTCSISMDTGDGWVGQIKWRNYILCCKNLHNEGCGYTMTYEAEGRLVTTCVV
ncbi:MAG: hypothetical protein OXH01_03795 [Bacteroidetes bacterium]|nr:hypothetical protein [Bacteroidota bacterium]